MPLALASLAWPAIAHWCRRLVDTLAALVLGKFVIVSVLSLAAGALAGGSAAGGGGAAAGGGGGGGGGFAAVLGGAALLLLAAFAPWALFRLIPFMEAGAVGHLEGLGRRAGHQAAVPARGLAQVAMRTAAAHSMATAASAGLGLPGSGGAVSAGTSSTPSSPLAGASSAEVRGVGTMSPPGAGIPLWEPHPAPSAAAGRIPETFRPDDIGRRQGRSLVGEGADDLASSESSASVQSLQSLRRRDEGDNADGLRPLPKQSGVLWADSLGRDRLGVKLVSKAPASDGDPGVPAETPRLPDPDDG